jgi:hypothetical protein
MARRSDGSRELPWPTALIIDGRPRNLAVYVPGEWTDEENRHGRGWRSARADVAHSLGRKVPEIQAMTSSTQTG